MPDDPKLPPAAPPAKMRSAKVVDLARAVATRSAAPVLDIVKRRMYRDWLRGVSPRALRITYGAGPKPLTVAEIDAILREQARAERNAA